MRDASSLPASVGRGRYLPALPALLVLGSLSITGEALAWDFEVAGRQITLSGTNTLEYTYFLDNEDRDHDDDKYHQIFNTLDVSLSSDDFRLGGRFDFYQYINTPFEQHCDGGAAEPGWCNQRDQRYIDQYLIYRQKVIVPERLFFVVARPEFDLTLGDFYASLGKGIALNVVKISELGQDTTIRGGKLVVHHGDVGVTFLAGEINPLDVDKSTGIVAPWAAEPLLAGRLEYRFFDTLLAGVHGVWVISDDPNALGTDQAKTDYNAIWGVGLEAPSLWGDRLNIAAELDIQRTVKLGSVTRGPGAEDGLFSQTEGFPGIALYQTATLQLNEWTLLAEFKHYNDFRLQAASDPNEPYVLVYHQPPTLERVIAEVSDNISTTGGRLQVDYNFGELGPVELSASVNYAFFVTRFNGRHHVQDPYASIELSWQGGDGHLELTSGLREECDQADDAPFDGDGLLCGGGLYRRDVHTELSLEQAVGGPHSLKLSVLHQNRRLRLLELEKWNEVDTALEYKWSPHLALAFTIDYQGDPRAVPDPQLYFGGSARYFFDSSTYVGVRAGQNRGGLKCLNGICRFFPPFSGVRIFGVARF